MLVVSFAITVVVLFSFTMIVTGMASFCTYVPFFTAFEVAGFFGTLVVANVISELVAGIVSTCCISVSSTIAISIYLAALNNCLEGMKHELGQVT